MSKHFSLGFVAAAGTLAVLLAGCGHAPVGLVAPQRVSAAQVQSVPPQSQFVTIQVSVTKILPKDTSGLPHQNFVVKEISPDAGQTLDVNNDTKFGSEVTGLKVGQSLTIRGVVYHNGPKSGIHWTHKANKPGDAGFIKTADGKVFE